MILEEKKKEMVQLKERISRIEKLRNAVFKERNKEIDIEFNERNIVFRRKYFIQIKKYCI